MFPFSIPGIQLRIDYGGADVTQVFHWLLKKSGFPHQVNPANKLDAMLLSKLKHEFCHVNLVRGSCVLVIACYMLFTFVTVYICCIRIFFLFLVLIGFVITMCLCTCLHNNSKVHGFFVFVWLT